jgi:ATP-dependent protease HslVU (ClpYQ) peptidase subunit
MKRTLIIPAAFALLTSMSANAQEVNEDAPAVNASRAAMFDEIPADQAGMTVQDLNELQRARLEQNAMEISEMTGKAPVIVADTPEPEEEIVFTVAREEVVVPDDSTAEVAVGGPYYESEAEAVMDGDLNAPPADTPPDTPDGAPQ